MTDHSDLSGSMSTPVLAIVVAWVSFKKMAPSLEAIAVVDHFKSADETQRSNRMQARGLEILD